MSEQFFEKPILNSPYEYPGRHWELDADGQPTNRRLCRILCPGAFRYAIGKRSSNMIANWLLTACHSRTERFHS